MADLDADLDLCIDYSENFGTSDVQRPNWCWESATEGQTEFWRKKSTEKKNKDVYI